MKLADAHLHLFRQGYSTRYGPAWARTNEVQLYDAFRRVHGIERGLVVGYEGLPQFRGNNGDLARWVKQRSWMAPLAYYPVTPSPPLSSLERWKKHHFVGVSLYVLTPGKATRLTEWSKRSISWLNNHKSIMSINARPEVLTQLAPFLEKLEGCRILISHLGLPGSFAAPPAVREVRRKLQPLRALAKLRHLGVKLSGFYAISRPSHNYPHRSAYPFLQQVYDDFGPNRLYWGSDFSPALEHVTFAQTIDPLLRLNWSPRDLRQIMGGNLLRDLLRLNGSANNESSAKK